MDDALKNEILDAARKSGGSVDGSGNLIQHKGKLYYVNISTEKVIEQTIPKWKDGPLKENKNE